MSGLAGPRRAPSSGGAPDQLVVFLHGYGADGSDLIALADHLARDLPTAAFLAPDAPQRMAPAGRAWFPLTMRDPSEYLRGVSAAAPALARGLEEELEAHALTPDRLAIVGFSQGTMMALHVAYRLTGPVAGVVGFSGLCADAGTAQEGLHPAPTLLIHGMADEVVPAGLTLQAAQTLGAAEIPVEWHLVPGLGHGIDPTGLSMAAEHLKRCLLVGKGAVR